jgi:hypothetical protein
MCCATTKVDRHPTVEPLMFRRIWAATRFEAGDPRVTTLVEIIGGGQVRCVYLGMSSG